MKRTHFALACASALLLSSCFNKNGDGPSRPSIPPRSLLAGKVEMRTTTLLDASSKAIGRIEETFGKQGERLRRDSSELNGTTLKGTVELISANDVSLSGVTFPFTVLSLKL